MLYVNDRIRFAPDGGGSSGPGQEPDPSPSPDPAASTGSTAGDDEAAKLRAEAAKWRVQYREAQEKLKELTPAAARLAELEEANKTAEQKQAERLARLETELAQQKAAAETAVKRNRLTVLATKAGVSPDVLEFLDASKFDLDNEEATLTALGGLAKSQQPSGSPSNPGRSGGNGQPTPKEWYEQHTGKKTSIFGG